MYYKDGCNMLMDKPTRTLVSARCKGVNEGLGLCFKFEPKSKNSKKPKSLDTLKFKKWSKILCKRCYEKIVT